MSLRGWVPFNLDAASVSLVATTGAALLIAGLSVPVAQWAFEKPNLGVTFRSGEQDSAVVVTEVAPGGTAERAGVRPGDTLLAVGKLEVPDDAKGQARLWDYWHDLNAHLGPGDTVEWDVRRGGTRQVLAAEAVPDIHRRMLLGSHLLVFGAFWAISFFLLYARPREKLARHLTYTILALTPYLLFRSYEGPVTSGLGLAVDQVQSIGVLLGPPLVVHFGLLFPVESVSDRIRWWTLGGAYGLWFFVYLIGQGTVLRALRTPSVRYAIYPEVLVEWSYPAITFWLFIGSFLACGALMIHTYWHVPDETVREKVKWVVWSIAMVAALDALGTGIAFYFLEGPVWFRLEPYRTLLYLVVAGGLLTAIFRHDLFDVDAVIRQSAIYMSTSGALFAFFVGTEEIVSNMVSRYISAPSQRAGTVVAALLCGALFQPLQQWVEDRVFALLPDVPEEAS